MKRTLSYPKHKISVLLLEKIDSAARTLFEQEGYQVRSLPASLPESELIREISDVQILGIRSKTQVTDKVLEAGKKLQTIGAFCIGTNQIDTKASVERGIPVFNAPYSNTRSVVELILGEIIILFRKVIDKNANLHQGVWDKSSSGCHEIRGKTLGIIGYGNIGSQLSVLAENLGMQVIYYDISDKLSLGNARSCKSMEEVLTQADVVTVHVDGRKENINLIGKKQFESMKKGAIFLNASRGYVVDIPSLCDALSSHHIGGCAIDVFPEEPKSNGPGFTSPLRGLPNTILTPHIGAGTQEAQANIASYLAPKLIQFINTGSTTKSVDFPEIQLSEQGNVHRLIHMHKNIPGVLAKINHIFAQNKINIESQYLKTNEYVGYVITDVNRVYGKSIVQNLRDMKETIRLRVLY